MSEIKYVEMICHLREQTPTETALPIGFKAHPLVEANEDDLYQCYYAAFQAGDAQFFFDQSVMERRAYFDSLCISDAHREPASVMVTNHKGICGFTCVIPYGEGNRHISCMCVRPDFQRQGLGAFMVQYVIKRLAEQGLKSITLGTDTSMGAFQLYAKHGFKIVEEIHDE